MTHTHKNDPRPLSLPEFRQSLAEKKNKVYWRSLNELADREDFEELVRQEFPRQANLLDSLSRRDFLKVLGASLALAGLAACAPRAEEKIVPYVRPPEEVIPARSTYYASAMVQDGYAKGVLIETAMGRPIKVEGLPNHPDSLGASDVFMQASILDLYDPDRVKQVMRQGAPASWQDFAAELGSMNGAGLRILTGPLSSPALNEQIMAVLDQFSGARWHIYSPLGRVNGPAGARQAFGSRMDAVYDFSRADVILSLDCDFLFTEPGHLRYSRDFIDRHQPVSANGTMSRLYVVEPTVTLTGSNADHRLAVSPGQVEVFARAIASRLGVGGQAPSGDVPGQAWLDALAADLQRAGSAGLVLAGERQPPAVHALAYAMNQALGSIGTTVQMIEPVMYAPPEEEDSSLGSLVEALNAGQVDTLVILGDNPVYSAPADFEFGAAMQKAGRSIYLADLPDETAALATWVIPAAHFLEMWGDSRAFDGTVSLVQPVIEPLYEGKSPLEVLAALRGQADAKGYDLLRAHWQAEMAGDAFERDWQDALARGMLPGTVLQTQDGLGQVSSEALGSIGAVSTGGLVLLFEPDPTIWDGRFANNAWLQELPKPLTKLTWDNAALFSPQTAARLGLANEDQVTLAVGGRTVQAPVSILPGQPDDVVSVSLGYGRTAGGRVLDGTGFNAYSLRDSSNPWFASGLEVTKVGGTFPLAVTYEHWTMENRDLVRSATQEEYQSNPNFAHEAEGSLPSLYGEWEYPTYAWGMSINLSSCIGCNACVVACQSENNIPTVGKDQVMRAREMHWLRIDRYYEGRPERPHYLFQPVPCMHCEKAPCEPVCPVTATSHSAEGINEMTYNRCVGTRYCSNNCPYKVRRFNFYKYVNEEADSLRALRNPDVTVRSRGVMEKCTYCVQRVNEARIQAEVEGRPIRDGEVRTACQQACPTRAIIFGDINDSSSQVRMLKDTPLNYGLLEELGTQPRTTYLARVTNPNPLIAEES